MHDHDDLERGVQVATARGTTWRLALEELAEIEVDGTFGAAEARSTSLA